MSSSFRTCITDEGRTMPNFVLAISLDASSAIADVIEVGREGSRVRYWLRRIENGWSLESDAQDIATLLAADPQQFTTFGEAVASLLEVAAEDTLGPWIDSRLTHSPENQPGLSDP